MDLKTDLANFPVLSFQWFLKYFFLQVSRGKNVLSKVLNSVSLFSPQFLPLLSFSLQYHLTNFLYCKVLINSLFNIRMSCKTVSKACLLILSVKLINAVVGKICISKGSGVIHQKKHFLNQIVNRKYCTCSYEGQRHAKTPATIFSTSCQTMFKI